MSSSFGPKKYLSKSLGCSSLELLMGLGMTSLAMVAALVLVMAEEFPSLPEKFREFSSSLALQRNQRTALVVIIICLMSVSATVSLVSTKQIILQLGKSHKSEI
jgi:hypothetical protein